MRGLVFYLSSSEGIIEKFFGLEVFDYWVHPAQLQNYAMHRVGFLNAVSLQGFQVNAIVEVCYLKRSQPGQGIVLGIF